MFAYSGNIDLGFICVIFFQRRQKCFWRCSGTLRFAKRQKRRLKHAAAQLSLSITNTLSSDSHTHPCLDTSPSEGPAHINLIYLHYTACHNQTQLSSIHFFCFYHSLRREMSWSGSLNCGKRPPSVPGRVYVRSGTPVFGSTWGLAYDSRLGCFDWDLTMKTAPERCMYHIWQ